MGLMNSAGLPDFLAVFSVCFSSSEVVTISLAFSPNSSNVLLEITDLSFCNMSLSLTYLSFFLINNQAFSCFPFSFTNENSPLSFSPLRTKLKRPFFKFANNVFSGDAVFSDGV
ncbi:hypothetical protein D3C85_1386340 [compost metagenome]